MKKVLFYTSIAAFSVGAALLSGCSGNRKGNAAPIVSNKIGGTSNAYKVYDDGSVSGTDLDFYGSDQFSENMKEQIGHMTRNVYFGFDQYSVGPKGRNISKENATFLIQHPDIPVMLTGNTDPRGSETYNFHLGQRRADAVKNQLIKDGVPASQICTVSYGELRPAFSPSDFEGDWVKAYKFDRRVEILYGQTCEGHGK